jgi:hypothetical protein
LPGRGRHSRAIVEAGARGFVAPATAGAFAT